MLVACVAGGIFDGIFASECFMAASCFGLGRQAARGLVRSHCAWN